MYTEAAALQALDILQSKVMREQLLGRSQANGTTMAQRSQANGTTILNNSSSSSNVNHNSSSSSSPTSSSSGDLLAQVHRLDGRGVAVIRPRVIEACPLPRVVHGSGLFQRGDTQSLASATVGDDREQQQVGGGGGGC